ncbi:YraN family protein [Euzebya tangerina]|uniref:YraN family protein n=1 Tax=Euzebya tangerina TaxID=591198 RepID=UPI000E322C9B|nr:YraN family protein [Euzebya tangerina]
MHRRQQLGAAGEARAAAYLTQQGYRILHRNWRPDLREVRGELDIVAREADGTVVVEVRTRSTLRAGTALESVDRRKRRRLRLLCAAYQYETGTRGPLRGDVITIYAPLSVADASTELRHLRGVW